MKDYTVYMEIFGKKMKTTVMAQNEEQAKEVVKNKIIFHKIQKTKNEFDEAMEMMKTIFGKQ